MAKSGGGKTFMVQQLLSMASRANPLVSIIERGDSYRPLVELMGGRMITMSLDTNQTINPWDLPQGEKQPAKDQTAFLKNLTRHMLGENPAEDTQLLDNLITEAILRTYKRAAIRPSNPIPTFSDLRDELSQWRDEEKSQRVMDEAHLAAIKLRSWTGEKGIYSRLFDHPTTISLDNPWLFFNVEQLADEAWYDRRLKEGVQVFIAHPKLVETGLDLLFAPTIIFHESGYSLHTLRQASRRSWRIGQSQPVRVKFLCYQDTMQAKCLRLMGKKLLVALAMEGKFAGEGLQTLDEDDDMLTSMAKELVEKNGIGESADALWKRINSEHQRLFPTRTGIDISATEFEISATVDPDTQMRSDDVREAVRSSQSVLVFGERAGELQRHRR